MAFLEGEKEGSQGDYRLKNAGTLCIGKNTICGQWAAIENIVK